MDVADNGDWSLDVHHVALAHEQLLCLGTYCLDDGLGEQFFLIEARDALVQVDGGYEGRVMCQSRCWKKEGCQGLAHLVKTAWW